MQIGLCPEAANHLQEMKDMLIAISNELLDDVNELCLLSFAATFRNDPVRFDSEVHLHNEAGGYAEWNSSSVSSSSTDKLGFSSFPVEREPYIPKFVEVNYTEGFEYIVLNVVLNVWMFEKW
ncbi:putative DNA helicase [Rosa chinensis]|uniref:Putative DNA helicase n=1 Tax=Rosa chinensis TaxID=74649 RepID=A0A2P6RYX8_ROSCH|nr:putative DNA helicase [Rosa chinensis]